LQFFPFFLQWRRASFVKATRQSISCRIAATPFAGADEAFCELGLACLFWLRRGIRFFFSFPFERNLFPFYRVAAYFSPDLLSYWPDLSWGRDLIAFSPPMLTACSSSFENRVLRALAHFFFSAECNPPDF